LSKYRKTGELLRRARKAMDITRGKLAAEIGYKNIAKGSRRIYQAECGECASQMLVRNLVDYLGIDEVAIRKAIAEDEAEYLENWDRWADTPIRPYLVLRAMACVYFSKELPEDIADLEQAEAWASTALQLRHMSGCLVWTRRLSVWFNADGSVDQRTSAKPDVPNEPWMEIGGKSFSLKMNESSITIQQRKGR
jgi:transcriptional regulator with XRE-family HTH domain